MSVGGPEVSYDTWEANCGVVGVRGGIGGPRKGKLL